MAQFINEATQLCFFLPLTADLLTLQGTIKTIKITNEVITTVGEVPALADIFMRKHEVFVPGERLTWFITSEETQVTDRRAEAQPRDFWGCTPVGKIGAQCGTVLVGRTISSCEDNFELNFYMIFTSNEHSQTPVKRITPADCRWWLVKVCLITGMARTHPGVCWPTRSGLQSPRRPQSPPWWVWVSESELCGGQVSTKLPRRSFGGLSPCSSSTSCGSFWFLTFLLRRSCSPQMAKKRSNFPV